MRRAERAFLPVRPPRFEDVRGRGACRCAAALAVLVPFEVIDAVLGAIPDEFARGGFADGNANPAVRRIGGNLGWADFFRRGEIIAMLRGEVRR